jgi:hypothetical protein
MSAVSLMAEILFVGHSLVGPDLPRLVEAALNRLAPPAVVEAQVINGAPLRVNWAGTGEGVDAKARLATGEVDALVLAEAVPLDQQVQWNDTVAHVTLFGAAARAANPATQVYLYEVWPSLASGPGTVIDGDPGAGVPWRERIAADAALLRDVAAEAGARLGGDPVRIIPAGQAMLALSDAIDAGQVPGMTSLRDAFADDIHPDARGLYFLVMVHAAALSGQSPEGLPAQLLRSWASRDAVIPEDQAAALQRIAWQAVQAAPQVASLPPPATGPPDLTPITNANLAFGLNGVTDWSVQVPFLDLMKSSRPWTGHLPGQFGGWDHARLAEGGYLDADGWLTAMPPELAGVSALMLTDLPADAGGVAGTYLVRWQGRGEVVIEGRATDVRMGDGEATFSYAPGPGFVAVTIRATDTADPVRAISVVRQDRAAALDAGEVFNPDWLARLQGVRMIRFMDWMATNDSTLSRAADRPLPSHATWARIGVPMEVMVALANRLGAEAWFTLPHLADDDLVATYAGIARATLRTRAWVEFSNEVWNWQFAQARWAEEQARARWGQDSAWVQFYALRAGQVADIWAAAYADAPDRLVRVVATQTGWLGLEEQILAAPLVMAEGLPAPATQFDAYAVTGYFSGLLGSEAKLPMVRGWLADPATALDRAAQEVRDGSLSGDDEDSVQRLLTTVLPHHAAVAGRHGLDLVMYEGGTHVVGYGAAVDDPALTAFFHAFNYAPQMAGLYAEVLAGWGALTDAPFNAFVDVAAPSKWGSWGALRHLADDNPRWQALAAGCAPC